MADPSQALVPSAEGSFALASLERSDAYTRLELYKSKGADPFLSKSLDKSLISVSQGVTSAKASFMMVDRIIGDPGLQICREVKDSESLRKEWEALKSDFDAILVESRAVAKFAAAMIDDFLSTVMPYLFGDEGSNPQEVSERLRKKQSEMREYRKTLVGGGRRANIFAKDLNNISVRVLEFGKKWATHTKDTVTNLSIEIEQLQKDISAASASVAKSGATFSSMIARKHLDLGGHGTQNLQLKVVKKRLQGLVKETKEASKAQKKTDGQVIKRTGAIQERTDDLIMLWNLIHDDVGVIEGQIKISENGKAPEVFRQRVDKLGVQYIHLRDALNSYWLAVATVDRSSGVKVSSGWRKLIGL